MSEVDKKRLSQQKFVIKTDGTIKVDWVNPDFSDIIINAVMTKEQREDFISTVDDNDPKIWCG